MLDAYPIVAVIGKLCAVAFNDITVFKRTYLFIVCACTCSDVDTVFSNNLISLAGCT
jgi:hypothetical protein